MRPVLQYYGGKSRLAPWICGHLANIEHDIFVDVFGGAGNIILYYLSHSPRARVIIYNDLDDEVVNFFDVLRNTPDQLIDAIKLTPYSRVEHSHSFAIPENANSIERARMYYTYSWQSFAATTGRANQGWRRNKTVHGGLSVDKFRDYDNLLYAAELLGKVQIEHLPFEEILEVYDGPRTLFYCDPPYMMSERNVREKHAYKHEFHTGGNELKIHEDLSAILNDIQGYAAISHKPSDVYQKLYSGWRKFEKQARNTTRKSHTEVLFVSPNASVQMNLFS